MFSTQRLALMGALSLAVIASIIPSQSSAAWFLQNCDELTDKVTKEDNGQPKEAANDQNFSKICVNEYDEIAKRVFEYSVGTPGNWTVTEQPLNRTDKVVGFLRGKTGTSLIAGAVVVVGGVIGYRYFRKSGRTSKPAGPAVPTTKIKVPSESPGSVNEFTVANGPGLGEISATAAAPELRESVLAGPAMVDFPVLSLNPKALNVTYTHKMIRYEGRNLSPSELQPWMRPYMDPQTGAKYVVMHTVEKRGEHTWPGEGFQALKIDPTLGNNHELVFEFEDGSRPVPFNEILFRRMAHPEELVLSGQSPSPLM